MRYLISDTHFNHINIIDYEDRPFSDVGEMNSTIIENWNKVISNQDTIYHLGDFGWGNKEVISDLISKLNGYKVLVMGNHDKRHTKTWWHKVGFNDVIEGGLILDDFYILTHKPTYMNKHMPYVNIHGHTHSQDMAGSKHVNISIEKMGYKPVLFEDLKKLINEKEKETMEKKMTMIQAKMIQKVEEDYDKYWERYEELDLEEKQERVYQNYILEEMLNLVQLGIVTDDETAETIYGAEDSVAYLVNQYQTNRDMALAEEEIKDFLLELQGE